MRRYAVTAPFCLFALAATATAATAGCRSSAAPPSTEVSTSAAPETKPTARRVLATHRPRPREQDPEVASLLHPWAIDHHVGAKLGSQMALCPVRGATFLCGRPGVYRKEGDAFIRDVDSEAGLVRNADGTIHGFVTHILGRWPDDAWLVSDAFGIPPYPRTVYHWSGARWDVVVPDIGLDVTELIPWRRAGAIAVENRSPDPLKSKGIGAAKGSSLPIAPASGSRESMSLQPALLDDGAVLAVVRFNYNSSFFAIERWATPSSPASIAHLLPPDVTVESLSARSAKEVDVCGWTARVTQYIERFDGTEWTRVEPPEVDGQVLRYLRAGDKEWAIAGDAGMAAHLFSREPEHAWQAETMPNGLEPADLWATDDGIVWVLATGDVDRGWADSAGALLLSTAIPQREIDLAEE
jgi:hypothetical protein